MLYYSVYKLEKQHFLAIYELEKILDHKEITPQEEIDLRSKKAELLSFLNKKKEAYQEYEKILQLDDLNLEANLKMGEYLFGLKYYKTAKTYLTRVLEIKKDLTNAQEMFFEILIDEGNYFEAKKIIKNMIANLKRKNKKVPCKFMHKLASANYFIGDHKEALLIIEGIDESYKENEELNLIQALCLHKMNHEEEAKFIFRKVLDRHVDNYSLIFLRSRYIFSEILYSDKEIMPAIEQVNYIAQYEKPYLDNAKRKLVFDRVVENNLISLLFDDDGKEFISKTKKKHLEESNEKFLNTLIHGIFAFSLVFKKLDNSYKTFFYHYDINPLNLSEWNKVLKAIHSDYDLKLNCLVIHSFFDVAPEVADQYHLVNKVEEKIGLTFVDELDTF